MVHGKEADNDDDDDDRDLSIKWEKEECFSKRRTEATKDNGRSKKTGHSSRNIKSYLPTL